jgi:hypothetical protein
MLGNHSAITELGRSINVRSLFSKYEEVENPILSQFISSIPGTFSSAVKMMLSSSSSLMDENSFILKNRMKLRKYIEEFHFEANTNTNKVIDRCELLSNPATEIITSIHQPNLFAYSGVFKKIVLSQTIKRTVEEQNSTKKIIDLFLIVDHDFMDDVWIRVAQLPSIHHSHGILELRLPISNLNRWRIVSQMPLPNHTILHYWRRQINSWIKTSISRSKNIDKLALMNNFEDFWRQVENAYGKAKTYADFNSFLMSQIVNNIWKYDTLFVRLSKLSPVFEEGFKFLISNFSSYSDSLRRAETAFLRHGIQTGVSSTSYLYVPLWLHCSCGSKGSVKIKSDREQLELNGICMSCKKNLHLKIGNQTQINLSEEIIRNLSPRAIPILLLLSRDLGVTNLVSGTGGSMDYTVVASIVFRELGIDMPRILVWPSNDVYAGFSQSEAMNILKFKERSYILRYLEELKLQNAEYENKIKPLIVERARKIKEHEPIQILLSNLFNLKEEQRKIRQNIKITEKVSNALGLKPCFIDYAVNFGMMRTEQLWHQNLSNNKNLISPVVMT